MSNEKLCPKCKGKLKLKKDASNKPSYIYCEKKEVKKVGDEFKDIGACNFQFFFNQKTAFNMYLNNEQMTKLVLGESIFNQKGDTLKINIDNEDFREITYAPDEDF